MTINIIRLVAFLLLLSVSLVGCASQSGEGFAVYRLAEEVLPSEVTSIRHLQLIKKPFISASDIISYHRVSHTMEIKPEILTRIKELEVPMSGMVFVVAVDCQPIYWGAFWTPLSSESFNGVTVVTNHTSNRNSIQIQLGYPTDSYFAGDDPRSDPANIQALEEAEKLE